MNPLFVVLGIFILALFLLNYWILLVKKFAPKGENLEQQLADQDAVDGSIYLH